MERVDVAVVGGGPAGTAAAREAADRGAETVLLEKGVPRTDRTDPGPDSTDAAGILDYWVDLMDLHRAFPEKVIYRHLEAAEFIGPHDRVRIDRTGIPSSYPHFGFTYDRAAFDDWMLEEASTAGADCRIGTAVRGVETTMDPAPLHRIHARNDDSIEARALVLADGPQRTITTGVLDQFLPDGRLDALAAPIANHIAYQEYRRFPPELFDERTLKFWWGHLPGHTAYPWVFPNDETVARVGLTMPIGTDLSSIEDRSAYPLLRPEDEVVPSGREVVTRLLAHAYPGYDLEDFPVVTNRGKNRGTETYPISSTRPIESPVGANIAVVGGAMGATSAFHEGGAHVALRTGRIAGELAASDQLEHYNDRWRQALGEEILRSVAFADVVADYGPADWDRAFRVADRLLAVDRPRANLLQAARAAGWDGLRLAVGYRLAKFRRRGPRCAQLRAAEYRY